MVGADPISHTFIPYTLPGTLPSACNCATTPRPRLGQGLNRASCQSIPQHRPKVLFVVTINPVAIDLCHCSPLCSIRRCWYRVTRDSIYRKSGESLSRSTGHLTIPCSTTVSPLLSPTHTRSEARVSRLTAGNHVG